MEKKLIERLESAVNRLESLSSGFRSASSAGNNADDTSLDPSISAYQDLIDLFLGKVSECAEKIGGKVVEITNVLEVAFSVQKELLINVKQCQKLVGLTEFLKPLNEFITKANALTEGKQPDFLNHLKVVADRNCEIVDSVLGSIGPTKWIYMALTPSSSTRKPERTEKPTLQIPPATRRSERIKNQGVLSSVFVSDRSEKHQNVS